MFSGWRIWTQRPRTPRPGAEFLTRSRDRILAELRKVIVGQDAVIDLVLTALLHRRTLLDHRCAGAGEDPADQDAGRHSGSALQADSVHTRSHAGGHHRHRDPGKRPAGGIARSGSWRGPIFAQILLADEINRTPPKTQAALLEAMQEYHVTASGRTYPLQRPVLRAGHPEPDRARGHLSVARGPAGPVHVQRRHPVSLRGRRGARRHRHDG